MSTLLSDCDKGTFYNRLLDACVACPVQAEGCETIADERTKEFCLKACKACKLKLFPIKSLGIFICYNNSSINISIN